MSGVVAHILIGILAVMIVAAGIWDIRTRTIPNALNAAIALLAILFWWAAGLDFWPDIALRIGIAMLLLTLFTIAFSFGAMGGGDVKMIAALALWLAPRDVMLLMVVMSVAGGILTLFMLARHLLAKAKHQLEIPYGVAIAIGGMWLIGERFLNQFA